MVVTATIELTIVRNSESLIEKKLDYNAGGENWNYPYHQFNSSNHIDFEKLIQEWKLNVTMISRPKVMNFYAEKWYLDLVSCLLRGLG